MVNFRKMEERDRELVIGMMRTFYRSPAVLSNGSEEIFEADFSACVSGSPYLEGLVIELDGEAAGYAMLAHSFSTEFGRPCLWIEDLYILPEHRRKGLGRAFFEYIDRRFPGHFKRLEAEGDNRPAIALYEKMGYREMGYREMGREGV